MLLCTNDLNKYDYCEVEVSKFNGVRCERCWNYFDELDITDNICPRCHEVVNEKY